MRFVGQIFFVALIAIAPAFVQAGFLGEAARLVGGEVSGRALGGGNHAADALSLSFPASDGFRACQQLFPKGLVLDPRSVDARWMPQAICFSDFAILHSGRTKTPLVAIEKLTREHLARAKGVKRTDVFFEDTRLPHGGRSALRDYRGSRYDKGHLSPAGDRPDDNSMAESFALSNMVPQDPTNNSEIWSKVEADTRRYVRRARGDVFVYTGPIFLGEVKTIGSGVWVPTHLFKLVFDASTGRSWAHILPNSRDAQIGAPISYQEFVRVTGWNFLGEPAAGGAIDGCRNCAARRQVGRCHVLTARA